MEQLPDCDQLPRRFHDPVQRRYEIIRPVLLDECTATARAAHTHLHPDTIGTLKRRFAQQGMLGLFPAHVEVSTRGRRRQMPEAAVQELQRLKGLYGAFTIGNWGGLSLIKRAIGSIIQPSNGSGSTCPSRPRRPSRSWMTTATLHVPRPARR